MGEFTQASLPAGQGMTIGVKIKSGLITDNAPHLETDGSKLSAGETAGLIALAGVGAVSLIGSPIVGTLWWRKNGRDQRYAGLAPGTVPLPGQQAPVVPSDPDLPIPVAFTPPRIPVAKALNMYRCSLTLISAIDSFSRVKPTTSVRVVTIGITAVLSTIGALLERPTTSWPTSTTSCC